MSVSDARVTHSPRCDGGIAGKRGGFREVYDGMYREEYRLQPKTPIEAIIDVAVAKEMLRDEPRKYKPPATDINLAKNWPDSTIVRVHQQLASLNSRAHQREPPEHHLLPSTLPLQIRLQLQYLSLSQKRRSSLLRKGICCHIVIIIIKLS